MIKGIYADEADKLNPEQWVNIYHIDFMGEAIGHKLRKSEKSQS